VAFSGVEVIDVDTQVTIASGLPAFNVVGLPDKAVAESRERVRAALAALGGAREALLDVHAARGRLLELARQAWDSGVVMDIGHGTGLALTTLALIGSRVTGIRTLRAHTAPPVQR